MFFILSKLLYFFIVPFNYLVIFVLLALFLKNPKWKKRFKWLALGWFIFFSNPFIVQQLSLQWQARAVQIKPGAVYEAGILVGGFVQYNHRENQAYFSNSSDRFIQTLRLYKLGHIKKIIVSGGSGKLFYAGLKDADFAKEQLLQMGVPEADIIIENESRNSFENARNSKKILDSLQIPGPYLLITSAMHIRRSLATFRHAGLAVEGYPANFTIMDFPQGMGAIIPSVNAFNGWENLLKEVLGMAVYKITGKA